MRKNATPPASLKNLFMVAAFGICSTTAVAQNLNVTSDQVTVTSGGLGATALTINNTTGIATSITLPAASVTGGTATPNFAFTMASSGVADGTYTFKAGFVIDDDNSARRLEISIPSISMVFSASGATLNGSVPAGSSVNVRGRAADNTTQVSASLSNALFSFSGTTLSFNSANQVTEIQGKGGLLADIANTISANGAFSYKVVLKQLSGPATLQFGTTTGGFNALGCAPANAFELGSNGSSFSGGFGVQGQFKIVSGTYGAAPTAFAATCTTEISTGGGGGGTTTTDASIATAESDLTSANTAGEISVAIDSANTLASTVASQIAGGTASIATGVTLLETLNTGLGVIGTATGNGTTIDPVKVTNTLNSISAVLTAAAGQTPTAAQVSALQSVVVTTLSNLINTVPAASTSTSSRALLDQVTSLLNEVSTIPGSTITASLVAGGKAIALDTTQKSAASINQKLKLSLTTVPTKEQFKQSPVNQGVYLEEAGVWICNAGWTGEFCLIKISDANSLTNASDVSFLALQTSDSAGLEPSIAAASLPALANPASIVIDTDTGTLSGLQSLNNGLVLTLSGASASYDTGSATVILSANGLTIPTHTPLTGIVPDIFPEGLTVLPDGSAVSVSDGLAVYVIPASRDLTNFISVLEGANIDVTMSRLGVITLVTADGNKFSGTFGFDNVTMGTLGTDPVTFTAPTGDPANTSFVYQANYSDGTSQNIQPIVNDSDFYNSLAALGLSVTTDRSSGILVDSSGIRLRPDYFVTSVDTADLAFQEANKDSFGLSYRVATDFNGDGTVDLEVISASGKQILYLLP